MSRALVSPLLAAALLVAATGCSKLERADSSIHKSGAGKGSTKLNGKVKPAVTNSTKTEAILKAAKGQCLNLPALTKELKTGSDFYTVYTRDVDAGTLSRSANTTGSCLQLNSITDEKARAVLAFGSARNKPLFFATEAKDLGASPLGELLQFTGQEDCSKATYAGFEPASAGEFSIACSAEKSITVVRTVEDKIALARTYMMGTDSLTITTYQPAGYPVGCKATTQELFLRTIQVIKFGAPEKVILNRAFAKLINNYVEPKNPELVHALDGTAKKEQDAADSLTGGVKISSGAYALLHDAIEKKTFDQACK